jgi:hypothetical protein
MTGPLLKVLGTMPRALFAGVFFIVGVRRSRSIVRGRVFSKLYANRRCAVGIHRNERNHTADTIPHDRREIHPT